MTDESKTAQAGMLKGLVGGRMTPDELHELEGLLEKAAVVGPWAARFDPAFIDGWWITDGNSNLGTDIDEHDAALIVAAVNALPALLSDLREARERLARLEGLERAVDAMLAVNDRIVTRMVECGTDEGISGAANSGGEAFSIELEKVRLARGSRP